MKQATFVLIAIVLISVLCLSVSNAYALDTNAILKMSSGQTKNVLQIQAANGTNYFVIYPNGTLSFFKGHLFCLDAFCNTWFKSDGSNISFSPIISWSQISKSGSILNDIGSPTSAFDFNNKQLNSVATPTHSTDAQNSNHLGLLGNLVTSICINGQTLIYNSANQTWVCNNNFLSSINGQSGIVNFLAHTNATYITNSTGILNLIARNTIVETNGTSQEITKQLKIDNLVLTGQLNAQTNSILANGHIQNFPSSNSGILLDSNSSGTSLTGIGILAGSNTWTGPNTFTQTPTFQSGNFNTTGNHIIPVIPDSATTWHVFRLGNTYYETNRTNGNIYSSTDAHSVIADAINRLPVNNNPPFTTGCLRIEGGTYTFASNFSAFIIPQSACINAYNTFFQVPSGYTGYVWENYPGDPITGNHYMNDAELQGGYLTEQSPSLRNWGGILLNGSATFSTFRDIWINETGTGIDMEYDTSKETVGHNINGITFQNVIVRVFKKGLWMNAPHIGTSGGNGFNGNTFNLQLDEFPPESGKIIATNGTSIEGRDNVVNILDWDCNGTPTVSGNSEQCMFIQKNATSTECLSGGCSVSGTSPAYRDAGNSTSILTTRQYQFPADRQSGENALPFFPQGLQLGAGGGGGLPFATLKVGTLIFSATDARFEGSTGSIKENIAAWELNNQWASGHTNTFNGQVSIARVTSAVFNNASNIQSANGHGVSVASVTQSINGSAIYPKLNTVNNYYAFQPQSARYSNSTGQGTTATANYIMVHYPVTITPQINGNVTYTLTTSLASTVATDGCNLKVFYGNGTAPGSGALTSGTQLGISVGSIGTNAPTTFTFSAPISNVGTATWFEPAIEAVTGGTCTINGAMEVLRETQ